MKEQVKSVEEKLSVVEVCDNPQFHRRRMLLESKQSMSESERNFMLIYDTYNGEQEARAAAERQVSDLRVLVDEQKRDVDSAKAAAATAATEHQQAAASLTAALERAQVAEENCESFRSKFTDVEESRDEFERELLEKRDLLAVETTCKSELSERLALVKQQRDEIVAERDALKADGEQLGKRLKSAEKRCDELVSTAAEMRTKFSGVSRKELEEMQEERDAAQRSEKTCRQMAQEEIASCQVSSITC